ncbi:MAG: UDP-N-acetylglucosamine 2-epimerase (hydrolyzing) [Candidatus Omnitrophica bacterium]|nr:UDP-N-acetylglucosamine 2-epimerase (hydrolyzing) [Candidatus Omnitrophota bacterium]MBD3269395.1 UDP-N-acetylglucosamine 2-epimerase (hydrolyzing) [Candidatus Omnitrophota bacterium]
MRQTLLDIKKSPELQIEVVATGMHLMPEFGRTLEDIKRDEFKIHKIGATYIKDDKSSMVRFIGDFLLLLTKKLKKIKPEIIMVLGDRAEMLAGAVAGAYLTIPVAHIHGGDTTSTVDESSRHAITKFSHIHFPPTEKAKERIIKMGEDPCRVFTVGAVALDGIFRQKLLSRRGLSKKYGLDKSSPFLLVVQHPVTTEVKDAPGQIKKTLEAVKDSGSQAVVIYPNADAGGRKMIKVIEKYRKYPSFKIYKSIPYRDYLSLMAAAGAILGNSSSGIVEAPSFALPSINIGRRQGRRQRAANVIDVGYCKEQIKRAIDKVLNDKKFRAKLKKSPNPYGDGKAGERIVKILKKIKIDDRLLQKQITY